MAITAADVFRATMAILFEDADDLPEDEIYVQVFPEQIKAAMFQCLDVENSRRAAEGRELLTWNDCNHAFPRNSTAVLPFSDDLCAVVMPLYIASECMRDNGQADQSAYFYSRYVAALNERSAMTPTEVESVL